MPEFKSHETKPDNKALTRGEAAGAKSTAKGLDIRKRLAEMGYERAVHELSPSTAGIVQKKQKHSDLNSMKPGSEAAKAPLPNLKELEKLGYIIYPASSLDVLNSAAKEGASKPLEKQKVGEGGYDAVVSGTFYYGKTPVGAVMRDEKMETAGADKAKNRGGVAILEDGTIVVKRMQGNRKEDIEKVYGGENNSVKDFMGGWRAAHRRGKEGYIGRPI